MSIHVCRFVRGLSVAACASLAMVVGLASPALGAAANDRVAGLAKPAQHPSHVEISTAGVTQQVDGLADAGPCEPCVCIENDDCTGATEILCNSVTEACNDLATTSPDEPGYGCHNGGVGTQGVGNIWYKFVAANSSARLNTCASQSPADDSLIAVYSVGDPDDPCNTLSEIGCSDDEMGCIAATGYGSDVLVEGLIYGETYYVQLGSWDEEDRGLYLLELTCPGVAGACCVVDLPDITCTENVDRNECQAMGGRYGGNNSVCDPNEPNGIDPPCGAGACCDAHDLGFCAQTTYEECVNTCPTCTYFGDGTSCTDPGSPCAGACCVGNGDQCFTSTEQGCLQDPPDGLGGALWLRFMTCTDPGIDCAGSDQEICTIDAANCHLPDQHGHGSAGQQLLQSDLSILSQRRAADSFLPRATPITSACWWGAYFETTPGQTNCLIDDAFQLTYYEGDGGLPGAVIQTVSPETTRALTGRIYIVDGEFVHPEYEYHAAHADVDVTPDGCAWIEIANDTGVGQCRWYWATAGPGDQLAVHDADAVDGYETDELVNHDMAWCVDVPVSPADCGQGPAVHILIAKSILTHGAGPGTELAVDLFASGGVEPRRGGPARFTFLVDQPLDPATVTTDNVQVMCAVQTAPAIADVAFTGQTLHVELAEHLADADCCAITFNGMTTLAEAPLDAVVDVVPLEGDMNFSRSVTGGDALLIKAHFGELAGVDLEHPKWDYDLSGGVTGGDFSLIKTRFGNTAPACP